MPSKSSCIILIMSFWSYHCSKHICIVFQRWHSRRRLWWFCWSSFVPSAAPPLTFQRNAHRGSWCECVSQRCVCVCPVIYGKCVLVPVSQSWDKIQQPLKKMDGWREAGGKRERQGLLNLRGFIGPSNHWKPKKYRYIFLFQSYQYNSSEIFSVLFVEKLFFFHQCTIIWTFCECSEHSRPFRWLYPKIHRFMTWLSKPTCECVEVHFWNECNYF